MKIKGMFNDKSMTGLKKIFCIFSLTSLLLSANAAPDPYEEAVLVTNTITWPTGPLSKVPGFGNDTFQQGSSIDGNADSLLLDLVNKNGGLAFPEGFLFGVAHAAYQYEGHRFPPSRKNKNGIGWSMWDVFCEKGSWLNLLGDNISQSSPTSQYTTPDGTKAIQGYYYPRYHEDIELAKKLGVKAFRLSISWPRLFPRRGMKQADPAALNYYKKVLVELKSRGIEVYITLYHWDLPHWLYNFGDPSVDENAKTYGWLDPKDAKDNLTILEYQKYVAQCFEVFGKYTSYFSTFNEPLTFTNSGLYLGNHAPGTAGFDLLRQLDPEHYGTSAEDSDKRINYLQSANIIKAHYIAYKTFENYRTKISKFNQGKPAMLGIVVNSDWAEPYRIIKNHDGKLKYHPEDVKASERHMDFMLGWWLHPVMFGDWPGTMKQLVGKRLPDLTADSSCLDNKGKPTACEKSAQKLADYIQAGGALDYITLNHYTGYFVADFEFAKKNFSTVPEENKLPPDQYGTTPDTLKPGWSSDQQTFITQFRYQKYGNSGDFASEDKSRVYLIGKAGAQQWLRHSFFSFNKLLLYINKYYINRDGTTKQQLPFADLGIYLTENGTSLYGESQKPENERLHDPSRIEFIKGNLAAVWQAIQQGVKVKLYTYWSIADNFEWAEGYDSRFGLIWIDYEHNFARLLKDSYHYYQKVISSNKVLSTR